MTIQFVNKDDLERERTPFELWGWLVETVNQICSNPEGRRAFRLQNDKEKLLKKLSEEIAPLAIFGKHKFGDTDQVLLKPVIGNQNYDAKIIDKRIVSASETYVEITQAHEGEDDYLRRCELLKEGIVFSRAPVVKFGKGKDRRISIPAEATDVEEDVRNELKKLLKPRGTKREKIILPVPFY